MKNKVLIVDDVKLNREILTEILEKEYSIVQAADGREAVEILEEAHEELVAVLLDLVMPVMDGFGVMDAMREMGLIEKIPILIISSETAVKVEKKCFEYGVSDFIKKPFDNTLVKKRVENIIRLFQYQNKLEEMVEKQTETLRKQHMLLQIQAEKIRKRSERITDILGTLVECRNLESGQHIMRVRKFTKILAEEAMKEYPEYGLTEKKIETIVTASPLHDIGKIAIPDSVLLKPERLTDEEYELMKSHTVRGEELLRNIKNVWEHDYGRISCEICRSHHERYDGKGYPDGLVGEEIPLSAQLVSIADAYDALVSDRVYKSAFSKEEAFHMIMTGECGAFSPRLLVCFRNARKKFENLIDKQGEK